MSHNGHNYYTVLKKEADTRSLLDVIHLTMRGNYLFSVGVKDSHTPEGFEPGTVIVCANCVLMAAYFVGILGEIFILIYIFFYKLGTIIIQNNEQYVRK